MKDKLLTLAREEGINLKGTPVAQRHFSNCWKRDRGGGRFKLHGALILEGELQGRKMMAMWGNLGKPPLSYSSIFYVNSIP